MRKDDIRWLYQELPIWEEKGIITKEQSEKIHSYYGEVEERNWLQFALAIFGTLGAILIGAGIILLIAKNWNELSRTLRTLLSIMPTLMGQIIVGWVIYTGKESGAWREGSGTFLFLTVGSSIALIGQTYHIPGNMGSFLLTWMLLGLPLVYTLSASLPTIFYLIGITAWAGYIQSEGGQVLLFWLLAALVIPHVWKNLSSNISSNRSIFLCWIIGLTFCFSLGITLEKVLPGLWIIVYTSYFSILYVVSKVFFDDDGEAFWDSPFKVIGISGIFVISFLLTYEWPWRHIGWQHYRDSIYYNQWAGIMDYLITAVFLAAVTYLVFLYQKKERSKPIYVMAPFLALICYLLSSLNLSGYSVFLFNLFIFVAGIYTIRTGIKERHIGSTNGGMLLITALIVLRFFDMDLSFYVRGLAFIFIGIGFLVSNYLVTRNIREER